MKRIFLILLTAGILLSSCSAPSVLPPMEETVTASLTSKTEEPIPDPPEGFAAGFGRREASPLEGTPLSGFGNQNSRLSNQIADPITVTCVAFSHEGERALLFSADLISVPLELYSFVTARMRLKFGIEEDLVMVCATHTHSAPSPSGSHVMTRQYQKRLLDAMELAAEDALRDLRITRALGGRARGEGLSYVRRYQRADGSFTGVNNALESLNSSPLVAHESQADNEMQVIRLVRDGGKDILLVNWQCHSTFVGKSTEGIVSADYPGAFRRRVEAEPDVHFAYFLGASGNVVPSSRLEGEKSHRNKEEYARLLTQVLQRALEEATPLETGAIRSERTTHLALYNRDVSGYDAAEAEEIYKAFHKGDRAGVSQLCLEYGYHSYYHANAIRNRFRLKEEEVGGEFSFGALSFGDFALVSAPYEMFDTNGMAVKAASPFAMTFVCSCSGGAMGYIPSAEAFPHGCYEVDTCRYLPGIGEELQGVMLALLEKVKK